MSERNRTEERPRRTAFREIAPPDTAGLACNRRAVITPDGNAYAYGGFRLMSHLYLVEGLK